MFCPKCGSNVADGVVFCAKCGNKMTGGSTASAAPVSSTSYSSGAYTPGGYGNRSSWDGSVFDTFINSLVASLIMICTCYIATPWAICYMLRFIAAHAVVDGKRLRFDGDGASLFGNWFIWMLLTTITCGIYGFWVAPKLYQWIVSNIHHVDE